MARVDDRRNVLVQRVHVNGRSRREEPEMLVAAGRTTATLSVDIDGC